MSSLGSSFGSISGSGKSVPIALTFPAGWGVGPIFNWYYNELRDARARSIQTLQIRKDVTGPVPHRFIVLRMCNDLVHRFDRRPDRDHDVNANTVGLLVNHAVASQDTYVLDVPLNRLEQDSECEIELLLEGQVDLLAVISACYAISVDDSAREYTFLRHNCFFFSWTVLMVVSRHFLPYNTPPFETVASRFRSQLDRLTNFIVDEAIALFLDIVIETLIVFREKGGRSLQKGMSIVGRVVWALPMGVARFLWRRTFSVRLHLGLRNQLTKMVEAQLLAIVDQVYQSTLSTHMKRDLLDSHLWIEGTRDTIQDGLKKETLKILWISIAEAISSGLGNVGPEQIAADFNDPRTKSSLMGRNAVQLCAVSNAALHGGLQAVKDAKQDLEGLTHEDAFDRAWYSASGGALDAAQIVVKNTSATMNNRERDTMWETIFSMWDNCWKEAHRIVQPRSVETVERIVQELLATGVGVMIQDMRESREKTIKTYIPKDRKWLNTRDKQFDSITNAMLQEHMQSIIKKDTISAGVLNDVHTSMGRIWKEARQHLPVPTQGLGTIEEHDSNATTVD